MCIMFSDSDFRQRAVAFTVRSMVVTYMTRWKPIIHFAHDVYSNTLLFNRPDLALASFGRRGC